MYTLKPVRVKTGTGLCSFALKITWEVQKTFPLFQVIPVLPPMQNIGAYGVELKDIFYELEAWHIKDKAWVIFSNPDCHFGYRESVFKKKFKDQFIISSVTFRLDKKHSFLYFIW